MKTLIQSGLIALLWAAAASAATRHVPAQYTSIQAAINDCNDGDTVIIAPGTYTGPGNRDIDFLGKAVTLRSTDPNESAAVAATVIDCSGIGQAFYFHNGEDANSILDGLTIVNGFSDSYGGAIYCDQTSPTISRCVFKNNSAYVGGAIYYLRSAATITQCVFDDNSTTNASAGAVRIKQSSLIVADCTFKGNFSWTAGGAISCSNGAELTLRNCIFAGNSVSDVPFDRNWPWGGALSTNESSITIGNCLFVGHFAVQGGALGSLASDITINNCTFSDNRAVNGNALYSDYWAATKHSTIHIRNSIVWDGGDSIVNTNGSALLVTFTDIPGAWPGYGNIDADPCLVDPGYWHTNGTSDDADDDFWVNGDYHLKSQAGRWDANEGRWTTDELTSPCIDAGDPNSPVGLEPFPNGGLINMGAYGGTAEASKSYFGKPVCETIVAGDINGDCVVNALDLTLMAAHWLGQRVCPAMPSSPNPPDNAVDVPLTQVLTWRPSCDATSYKVYFGTTSPGQYRGQQEMLIFDPGPLQYNTTYYWHIRDVTPDGTIIGPTWTFRTPFLLYPASNPDPYDGQTDISTYPILTWTAGIGAQSHDVYFGTDYTAVGSADKDSPEYKGNQAGTTFNPGTLSLATTYYWRIDEVIFDGQTTTGQIWQFTIYSQPPR